MQRDTYQNGKGAFRLNSVIMLKLSAYDNHQFPAILALFTFTKQLEGITKAVYLRKPCRNAISGTFRMRELFDDPGRLYRRPVPRVCISMCVKTDRDCGQQYVS